MEEKVIYKNRGKYMKKKEKISIEDLEYQIYFRECLKRPAGIIKQQSSLSDFRKDRQARHKVAK